ncbi:CDP-alcohol phosphatidyltransferase family protein [Hyalangium rubrum]|uniref:CDP-alcohol phosphatidyltransferase family protein n=1 Tax=Hyalangium rubrum TaxID=3103134 RepID=A0ABU5HDY1_9BACT|nr:CDP-alcohol phosphatidyltransferase family protein [Hyalangium sp. s54d21]MDY7230305.1 CDP-alcohol phosphatidyltransferase family protein [Hyalangium sp. s54d21]
MRREPLLSPSEFAARSMAPPPEAPQRSPLLSRKVRLALLHTLSLSRLVLAAVFLMTSDALLRAGLIVLSGLTDVLDGWIARHARLTTRLGALLDPVGDRGFAVAAIFALLLDGLLTPLQVCVLLLRDVMTAIGYLVAKLMPSFRLVEFKARMLGKATTSLQTVTLLAALLLPVAVPALVAVVGVLAVAAVVDYTRAVFRARVQLRA